MHAQSAPGRSDVGPLRKPIGSEGYRILAAFVMIGMLIGGALGYLAVPSWEVAMITAVLAISGGLLGGTLVILLQNASTRKSRGAVPTIVALTAILVATGVVIAVRSFIASDWIRGLVLSVTASITIAVLRMYRQRRSNAESDDSVAR